MHSFKISPTPYLICKDYTVSGKKFELRKVENYDLLVTYPQPGEEELASFYLSDDYISHTDSKKNLFDRLYQFVKKYMLQKKLGWIENLNSGKGNLLDIGAGTGDFLGEAKKRGWQLTGVEPNKKARELAFKKGMELFPTTESLPDKSFDVVSMWHVLEHVPQLGKQIEELKRLLKEDGLLVVAVPNFKSYDAREYKEAWAAFDVPRHLYHFSKNSIEEIFREHSFELVRIEPLKFDSFYVSLLSEKYKSKGSLLKGIWTGAISNWKAKSSGEYSSLTYFLRKRD